MADTDIAPIVYGRRVSDRVELRKVAAEDIVMVDGKYGLFTPLTGAQESETDSKRNLEEIVEVLRGELAKAQNENAQLKEQLAKAMEKPARTPDDFVSAIQHSVDSLQGKLSGMKNPVSDFVVSEFSIDTRVFVDVTRFGTVDYRFVQPGDNIDPNLLSRLTLKIQPVPKQTQAGVYDRTNFTPFADVDEIQGIGDVYKTKLKAQNIFTVADLLNAGTRVRSRVELASLLEVDQRKLGEWLGNAELMTVKSIDAHQADVLFRIGVQNLAQLAAEDGAALLEKFNKQVAKMKHQTLKPASMELIAEWIKVAKLYVGQKQESAVAKPVDSADANKPV